jgi:hypothetical protein
MSTTINLPKTATSNDSADQVKSFFDRYFQHQVTFPSNQIDAVLGYFLKRGFDEEAAKSTSIVLLNQSRIENIPVFQLLDTLKGLTDAQLSQVITEVLNIYREKSSALGFRIIQTDETIESRNIRP